MEEKVFVFLFHYHRGLGGLCLRNIIFKKETYAFHIFFNRIFIYRIKIIGANYIISFLSDIKIQHESSDERD